MRVEMKAMLERGGDGVSCEVFFFPFLISCWLRSCLFCFFAYVYGSGVLRCPRRGEEGKRVSQMEKGGFRAYRSTTASINTLHIINPSLPTFSPTHTAAPKTVRMKIMNHRTAFTHWKTR